MHRDIKPDNIILEKNGNIKVFDFGISAYLENNTNSDPQLVSNKSLKGFIKMLPNEVLFSPFPLNYDFKIDVFALGFTIFSIMNQSKGKNFILPRTIEGKYGNMKIFQNNVINNFYDSWLFDFLCLLYENDKTKRPTAATALNFLNGFLTNPNLTALYNNLKIKRNQEISNVNVLFRRESFNQQPSNNFLINSVNNNQITNAVPNIMTNSSPININNNIYNINNSNIMNSGISEVEQFLRPNMGKENRIKSSMKCLLYILYKLDNMNSIRTQLNRLFNNPQTNYSNLVLYYFNQMMNSLQQLENRQINNIYYDQFINNFITTIFNNNNSGISGARPIILFYMMSSTCKHEFKQNFNNIYQNNIYDYIIQNNFKNFQNLLPLDNQDVLNTINKNIFSFKNQYKGPFVDNFYFIILFLSKCPQCNNLFGISDFQISTFLQLDVPNQENNITDLVNNFFIPKPGTGNYNCKNCGCQGKKLRYKYCLNLPNYLFLELEDKNKINFTDKISVPLYNGQYCSYQFNACIYKSKINDISSFGMILKMGDSYYRYFDDKIIQYSSNINLDFPSLDLYKRIFS
jgi:hypothetical protein